MFGKNARQVAETRARWAEQDQARAAERRKANEKADEEKRAAAARQADFRARLAERGYR